MKIINKKKLIITIQGICIVIIISMLLSYIKLYLPFTKQINNTKSINSGINTNRLKIMLPLLLSPIIEELVFRKWIPNAFQDILSRKKVIIFTNVIFSLLHFELYFVPFFANGLIYSWYYEKTKDLKVPITMHISYNALIFALTYR